MLNQNESELLSAYVDNELAGPEMSRVQECLANFAEWREELERIQKTKGLSLALPRVSAPADLLDFLEDQVQQHMEKKKFSLANLFTLSNQWSRWTWGGTMATAALFMISVGIRHANQTGYLPLEPLIAAHTHAPTDSLLQQNVVSASLYSSQLKNHVQNR